MATEIVICDTDVVIDYWNSNNPRHLLTKNILEHIIQPGNVLLSAITKMELIIGARNKNELNRINKNVHQFSVVLINDDITERAIQLLQNYGLSHGLMLPDALIAATALILEIQLFTYNMKDYRFINGLTLYEPKNI